MTNIESKVTLHKPVAEVYHFLADLNNHQQLMPDNVYNWSSTVDAAQFSIQNMAKLALKVESRIEDKEIHIIPAETPPFAVELNWVLEDKGSSTAVTLHIAADLNMMMKMMVSGPLQKLADHQISRLKEVLV